MDLIYFNILSQRKGVFDQIYQSKSLSFIKLRLRLIDDMGRLNAIGVGPKNF